MNTTELPAIKGLFKKGFTTMNNGWANCDRKKIGQIKDKILKAGFKEDETKSRTGETGYSDIAKKFTDDKGNTVYMFMVYQYEYQKKNGEEVLVFGNVDVYRGALDGKGYYDNWWNNFGAR